MGDRKMLWTVGALLAVVLGLFSMADGEGFRRYWKLRAEVELLDSRNTALKSQNAALVQEIQALRVSPQALERAAREELGYIAPGEVVMVLE